MRELEDFVGQRVPEPLERQSVAERRSARSTGDALRAHGGFEKLVERRRDEAFPRARVRRRSGGCRPRLSVPPDQVGDDGRDERDDGRTAKHFGLSQNRRDVFRAEPRNGFEEIDLLAQIVAHDVAVPALSGGLDDVAQKCQHARELAARLGLGRWRRVEGLPTALRKEHLDPRMRVALPDGVVVTEPIVRPPDEPGDVAGRDFELPQQHHHGR